MTLSSRAQPLEFERESTRAMFQASSSRGIGKRASQIATRYPPKGLHWNSRYRPLRWGLPQRGCDHPDGRVNQVEWE